MVHGHLRCFFVFAVVFWMFVGGDNDIIGCCDSLNMCSFYHGLAAAWTLHSTVAVLSSSWMLLLVIIYTAAVGLRVASCSN